MRWVLLIVGLASTGAAAEIRLVEAGIHCAAPRSGAARPATDTVSGQVHLQRLAPFDLSGQVVPLEPGIAFGIRTGLDRPEPLGVMVVIRHPALAEGRTRSSYRTTFLPGPDNLDTYSFDTSEEMAPGRWTYEIWAEGQRVLTVPFEVVPGPVPGFETACPEGFSG